MDWQINWNMEQHKYLAAEKEQKARRETLAKDARKEQDTIRLRHNR